MRLQFAHAYTDPRTFPPAVIDLDATLLIAHSDKQGAAGTFKGVS
jgi:hypothetical protein